MAFPTDWLSRSVAAMGLVLGLESGLESDSAWVMGSPKIYHSHSRTGQATASER